MTLKQDIYKDIRESPLMRAHAAFTRGLCRCNHRTFFLHQIDVLCSAFSLAGGRVGIVTVLRANTGAPSASAPMLSL